MYAENVQVQIHNSVALPRADVIKLPSPDAPAHTSATPGLAPVPSAVWLAELVDEARVSAKEGDAETQLRRVYAQASAPSTHHTIDFTRFAFQTMYRVYCAQLRPAQLRNQTTQS